MSDFDQDEIKRSWEGIVRSALPGVDLFASYHAKVVAQSADGSTLDIQPDDSRLPGMTAVQLRLGIPGTTVKVSPGCGVMLSWDAGDPSRPFCMLWDLGATMLEIEIKATNIKLTTSATIYLNAGGVPGSRPIARVGDTAGPYPIVGGNPFILG